MYGEPPFGVETLILKLAFRRSLNVTAELHLHCQAVIAVRSMMTVSYSQSCNVGAATDKQFPPRWDNRRAKLLENRFTYRG